MSPLIPAPLATNQHHCTTQLFFQLHVSIKTEPLPIYLVGDIVIEPNYQT